MKTCTWIILILYVQVYDSLVERTFRCDNGTYISKALYCNHHNDCGDHSDEVRIITTDGCWPNYCHSGKFGCDLNDEGDWQEDYDDLFTPTKCLDAVVRCNTVKDCNDGSDELNCGDQVNVGDCKLHDKKYLCADKLRCLDIKLTCNGECNCFDCSDEKDNCSNDVEECGQNRCEQKCIQFRQEQECWCDENYSGVAGTNNSKCVSNESKTDLLLYSTENEIGVINLYTNESHVIKNKIEVTSVTGAHGHVYFSTYNSGKGDIFKISNGSDKIQKIITLNSKVTSLAIDWITNNTYFTTNMSTINVCSENGNICKQLKNCNATSIGLAPRFGLMFWVMSNNHNSTQYILKSHMDGSNEKLLRVYKSITKPIQISVDELTEKIYFWSVPMTKLSFIPFDGSKMVVVIKDPNYLHYDELPAAFTVFERNFYYVVDFWHEDYKNKILVNNIDSDPFMLPELMTCHNSTRVTHLFAYNPKLQRTNIPNPCVESCPSTSSLCLLRSTSSRNTLNYTCVNDDLIRPHEENSSAEESTTVEIIQSTTETKQKTENITHPTDASKKISTTEETTLIQIAHSTTEVPKQNAGTEGISIVAVVMICAVITLSIVLCARAVIYFYLNKRSFFRNERPVETLTLLGLSNK